jgi:3-hydroxyacyl-CoA dehydrogenase / enoyl-CoA hydratase / 3-hydroxybutyryl-CoA epimerase
MVVREGRLGRKNGKGFYDYPANGPKSLWPGLVKIVGKRLDPDAISVKDLKDRYLFTVALEAARCIEEGIVTDPREADVGSILGFGYAPFTGGTISYIDGMGAKAFVELCNRLTKKYGDRFKPGKLLRDMAKTGDTFYHRFPPERRKAA